MAGLPFERRGVGERLRRMDASEGEALSEFLGHRCGGGGGGGGGGTTGLRDRRIGWPSEGGRARRRGGVDVRSLTGAAAGAAGRSEMTGGMTGEGWPTKLFGWWRVVPLARTDAASGAFGCSEGEVRRFEALTPSSRSGGSVSFTEGRSGGHRFRLRWAPRSSDFTRSPMSFICVRRRQLRWTSWSSRWCRSSMYTLL